jgi:hypothetical protein
LRGPADRGKRIAANIYDGGSKLTDANEINGAGLYG